MKAFKKQWYLLWLLQCWQVWEWEHLRITHRQHTPTTLRLSKDIPPRITAGQPEEPISVLGLFVAAPVVWKHRPTPKTLVVAAQQEVL